MTGSWASSHQRAWGFRFQADVQSFANEINIGSSFGAAVLARQGRAFQKYEHAENFCISKRREALFFLPCLLKIRKRAFK